MKEELKKAGKFEPYLKKIKDIIGVGKLYRAKPFGNADDYNTEMRGRVAAILMQDDNKHKWQDMQALKHWLDYTSFNGEIKPDGTFFHHNMIYTGYNFPAIGPLCQTLNFLHGSPFFSEKMYRIVRKSLLKMSYYSNDYVVHMFSGRWRGCGYFNWSMAKNFGFLAECGNPETGKIPDKETAAEYLYYTERFGQKTKLAEKYRNSGIVPTGFDGHLSLNYAVSSIHRRNGWMAVVRGMRKGIQTNEAYANQGGNTMGRYLNYGQIQIFTKPTPEQNGFPQGKHLAKGWDYNFFPGTTARVIPLEALRQHFMNVEGTTSEFFAGGTSLDGNGIFGMKLQEELPLTDDPLRIGPPLYWLGEKEYKKRCTDSMYDTSFKARKSMFFFGKYIIALGSGINSDDSKNITATTLFQNALIAENRNSYKGSFGNEGLPLEKSFHGNSFWMIDAIGNGYYVPANNDSVILKRKFMKKPYHINWNPRHPDLHEQIESNEGEIELAYIDHGKAPKNKKYSYVILVDTNEKEMREFTESMAKPQNNLYKVLRQDENAHIVHDFSGHTTGYIMFSAGKTQTDGLLEAVDKPCMLMIKEGENGTVRLSLYNPDFDSYEKFGSPEQYDALVKISLKGKWKLKSNNSQVEQSKNSNLIVRGKNAEPVIFELEQI
jgi:chondroitin-sulfate-ABC endolyase/exolyase